MNSCLKNFACAVIILLTGAQVNLSAHTYDAAWHYINEYQELAKNEMLRTGIPASIKLAQGMLESGFGSSKLANEGNNHFGIKCHNEWDGAKIFIDDDTPMDCFRKYAAAYDSYMDHSKILTERKRYKSLFDLSKTDYKAWAKGLKAAGYATDPQYANKLMKVIEKYDLNNLDRQTLNAAPVFAAAPKEVIVYSQPTSKTQPKDSKPSVSTTSAAPVVDKKEKLEKALIVPVQDLPKRSVQLVNIENEELVKIIPAKHIATSNKKVEPSSTTVADKEKTSQAASTPSTNRVKSETNAVKEAVPAEQTASVNGTSADGEKKKKRKNKRKQAEEEKTETAQDKTPATTVKKKVTPSELVGVPKSMLVLAPYIQKQQPFIVNKVRAVTYPKAVRVQQISTTYGMAEEEVRSLNDMKGDIIPAYTAIYLEDKREKHPAAKHIVESGDSMWKIAQRYGMDLTKLRQRNMLLYGQEPREGETILLKKQAPYPPKIQRISKYQRILQEKKEAEMASKKAAEKTKLPVNSTGY